MSKNDLHGLEKTVLHCNKLAIAALQEDNYLEAYELLSEARLQLSHKSDSQLIFRLKAITLNNFGCFYKRQRHLPKALQYLLKALSFEAKLSADHTNTAGTYLNISSIYSEMDDHSQALSFALQAINSIDMNSNHKANPVTLIVACQTAGNEYNLLGEKEQAKELYRRGYYIAVECLGPSHELSKNLAGLCKIGNANEKENPVIDRMLNYFRKHAGKGEKNRHFSVAYPLEKKKKSYKVLGKKKFSVKEIGNKFKHDRLQPIVSFKSSQITKKSMANSVSPAKNLQNCMGRYRTDGVVNKKINSIKNKIVCFQKKLRMFEENHTSVKSLPVIARPKLKEIKKGPKDKIILIQKYVRGWLVRKKIQNWNKAATKIQISLKNYIKKKKLSIRKLKPNEFSQQFSPFILKYETGKPSKSVKVQTIQIPRQVKKRSFLEKIIFLQHFFRNFLKKKNP